MPRPLKDEPEEKFVQRYMASPEAQEKFTDSKQRLAVAYDIYKNKDKKKKKKVKRSVHEMKNFHPHNFDGYSYKLYDDKEAIDAPQSEVSLDESRMSCTGIFATDSRDRQGDIIEIGGIDVSSHRESPIILLDHGLSHPLPIGVARTPEGEYTVRLDPENGIATQTTFFSQTNREAAQVFALIKEGILTANSIGFRPLQWKRLSPDWSQGETKSNKKINSCELIEISWVGVPANKECILPYLESGKIEGKALAPCIKNLLYSYAPARHSNWSPGVSISDPVTSKKSIETPQSWLDDSLGAPLVEGNKKPSPATMDLSKPRAGSSVEMKDPSQTKDFGLTVPGVFITSHGGGKYKVLMRSAAGDLQENMITGRNQAEQFGQRLANEHNLPVYFEIDVSVIANKDGTAKKSLKHECNCKDKSKCNCGVRGTPDTIEGTVDEVIDIAHGLMSKNKKSLTRNKNMTTAIKRKKMTMNGNSPKVKNDIEDGKAKVEQGKEAGPQGGEVTPQKPKSVKRTPEYKASEGKEQSKFNGTEKVEQGEEAGPEGGQDVKGMEDEEMKRVDDATPEGGPEGGESGRNVPGDPEAEHQEFNEVSEPDEEVKDDLENWEDDLEGGEEPLSAITLRDLHADLQKVHKVYSEAIRLMEHAKIKDYINKFLDAMMKGVSEVEQMFSKEHPDQPPLTKLDDGVEPDMEMEDMEEVEPEMEMEEEGGEEPEIDMDAEVKEPGGDIEDVEEEIEEPEDVPPGDKSYNGSTKGWAKADQKDLEEIKDFLDDLANQEVDAPSKKKAATAVLKYCSGRIKAMVEKGQKPVKIHPSKAGVTVKTAGQAPEGTTENKEQALEKKVKKGSQDSPPENMVEEKSFLSMMDAMERKQQRQKQMLGIA